MDRLDEKESAVRGDAGPPRDTREVVVRTAPGRRVHLSHDESWQLYRWLGERAPFVRHRLRTLRSGGTGDLSLSTAEERSEVVEAIEIGGGRDALTSGLLSLKLTLTGESPTAAPETPPTGRLR